MIQKKKFSDAIAANISVVGELIGTATDSKDGLMPSNTFKFATKFSNSAVPSNGCILIAKVTQSTDFIIELTSTSNGYGGSCQCIIYGWFRPSDSSVMVGAVSSFPENVINNVLRNYIKYNYVDGVLNIYYTRSISCSVRNIGRPNIEIPLQITQTLPSGLTDVEINA